MGAARQGRIILVRHGETEANRRRCFAESDDIPLTEAGRLQARQIAERLARDFRPKALVSSPFLRARQTAAVIADVLGLTAEALAGIHERDFGCLRGHPYERLGELMTARFFSDPAQTRVWKPEGGESLEDVRRRAIAALENLRERYAGHEVVVVCHGAVIRAICAHITGDWDETYVIGNCAVAVIEYVGQDWKQPVVPSDVVKM